jgi:hypothetical protein
MKYVGIAFLVLICIALLAVFSWSIHLFDVWAYNTTERIGVQQSLPYIQTKQAELVNLVQQVKSLDTKIAETDDEQLINTYKAQKRSIINKIEQDKSFIPADQVPVEARNIK